MQDTTVPPRSLDLEALDPSDVSPAAYYALCREADARGIPVSLDDPASPRTVEDLIAWVARDRDDHALVEALRDALVEVGIRAPAWVEENKPGPFAEWDGVAVLLDATTEDVGTGESGPSLSFTAEAWVNIETVQDSDEHRLHFYRVTDEEQPVASTVYVWGHPAEVAATLVGILRATGYGSQS